MLARMSPYLELSASAQPLEAGCPALGTLPGQGNREATRITAAPSSLGSVPVGDQHARLPYSCKVSSDVAPQLTGENPKPGTDPSHVTDVLLI